MFEALVDLDNLLSDVMANLDQFLEFNGIRIISTSDGYDSTGAV